MQKSINNLKAASEETDARLADLRGKQEIIQNSQKQLTNSVWKLKQDNKNVADYLNTPIPPELIRLLQPTDNSGEASNSSSLSGTDAASSNSKLSSSKINPRLMGPKK